MAKITRAQIEKWNGQLSGGFRLDVMHFVTWGESRPFEISNWKMGGFSASRLDIMMWWKTFGRWRSSPLFMCRCMNRLRERI